MKPHLTSPHNKTQPKRPQGSLHEQNVPRNLNRGPFYPIPANWCWQSRRSSWLHPIKKLHKSKSYGFWVIFKLGFMQEPQIPNILIVAEQLKNRPGKKAAWSSWCCRHGLQYQWCSEAAGQWQIHPPAGYCKIMAAALGRSSTSSHSVCQHQRGQRGIICTCLQMNTL